MPSTSLFQGNNGQFGTILGVSGVHRSRKKGRLKVLSVSEAADAAFDARAFERSAAVFPPKKRLRDSFKVGDVTNQFFAAMNVQLIHDEDPARVRIKPLLAKSPSKDLSFPSDDSRTSLLPGRRSFAARGADSSVMNLSNSSFSSRPATVCTCRCTRNATWNVAERE